VLQAYVYNIISSFAFCPVSYVLCITSADFIRTTGSIGIENQEALAQLELTGLLALILRTFTLELGVGQQIPEIDCYNLVGITKPAKDVRLTLKYRNPNQK
jgi:hypothetical protein